MKGVKPLSMDALSIWDINKQLHSENNHNVSSEVIISLLGSTL